MAPKHRLGVASHDLGGPTRGPLLLFLHANGFHGRVFLPMLPVFASHFRCVALDLPGHGSAPTPSGPFTAEELLAAVRDYVDAQGIQDCYCFGHSLGGAMAALLQHERPQTFRAMFLFEPVIRPHLQPDGSRAADAAAAASARVAGEQSAAASVGPQSAAASGRVGAPVGDGLRGPSGAASSGGGCGPSPSLLTAPSGQSESLLARMARKRQAVFPSVEAAKASLGAKPPFNTFQPQALHAYLACGGLRPLNSPSHSYCAPSDGAASSSSAPATATLGSTTHMAGTATGPSTTATTAPGAPAAAAAAPAADFTCRMGRNAAAAASGSAVTLSCAPENEARVYEALHSPPWRPWWQLTTGSGADCCGGGGGFCSGRDDACAGGDKGAMSGRGCGGGSDCQKEDGPVGWRPCRLAIAVGREVGIHAILARFGAGVVELVPGAQLIRFSSLHHLGPMEDPKAVAETALEFFARDGCVGTGVASLSATTRSDFRSGGGSGGGGFGAVSKM